MVHCNVQKVDEVWQKGGMDEQGTPYSAEMQKGSTQEEEAVMAYLGGIWRCFLSIQRWSCKSQSLPWAETSRGCEEPQERLHLHMLTAKKNGAGDLEAKDIHRVADWIKKIPALVKIFKNFQVFGFQNLISFIVKLKKEHLISDCLSPSGFFNGLKRFIQVYSRLDYSLGWLADLVACLFELFTASYKSVTVLAESLPPVCISWSQGMLSCRSC